MFDVAPRPWRFYLDDTIGFAARVIAYPKGSIRRGMRGR